MTRLRVLHCPTAVGGHPSVLRKAERNHGVDSTLVVAARNYLGYDVDGEIGLGAGYLRNQMKLWRFVAAAFPRADVIHYNFGSYLMQAGPPVSARRGFARRLFRAAYIERVEGLDMRLAKALGKTVVVTYQGDDARQGDWCREHYPVHFAHEVDADYYADDDAKRRRIAFVDRYADVIYALNPDILNVLPARARFLPYASVDLDEWVVTSPPSDDRLHIVHAPTHPVVKGTAHLTEALERLEAAGVRFRFTRVEGIARDDARTIYASADLVVDQLLAGWYGGLAVEAMALGKPVISHVRAGDLRFLPPGMADDLPVIDATPATIHDVLKDWLSRGRDALRAHGLRSRAFVERWHDPARIAAQVVADYRGATH